MEETVLHRAIVESIREVVSDEGCQTAIKNLQLYIRMYYGDSDENSTVADEARLNQLIEEVMQKAKNSESDSKEFVKLSAEIAETKKRIAEKKAKQSTIGDNNARMNEMLNTLNALKNHPIEYDYRAVRQLIDCVRVISKNEIEVVFKGGIEKTVVIE